MSSSSGRNHSSSSSRNNTSSSRNANDNNNNKEEEGFGVGAMLLAAGASALVGGLLGYFSSQTETDEAQVEHAQRTVPVQPPTECSICWEPLGTRPLEQLPCSHLFHLSCLTRWLQTADGSSGPSGSTKSCPICRTVLTRQQLAIYLQRCGL